MKETNEAHFRNCKTENLAVFIVSIFEHRKPPSTTDKLCKRLEKAKTFDDRRKIVEKWLQKEYG